MSAKLDLSGCALIVIAKAPVPGAVKTRLCPPCTPAQAARIAEAALSDTLAAVAAARVGRRVIALDGQPAASFPAAFEVVRQRGEGLAERLAAAFEDVGGPGLLIGMDTPQLTPALLEDTVRALCSPGVDALLGPTFDGGYWCVGLREPRRAAFAGVPMSRPDTYAAQLRRLRELGLRVTSAPRLRDVDVIDDARAVARAAPASGFAAALAALA